MAVDAKRRQGLAKLQRKEKSEQQEEAERELERQILMEAHVRGNFHRALGRWLEMLKVVAEITPVDRSPSA